jgi:hypothetical protein
MDVSIREVRHYTCIIIKILLFLFFCIFQNIHLIPCKYMFDLKRKLKNKVHIGVQYARPMLLKKSQHLSRTILSLN